LQGIEIVERLERWLQGVMHGLPYFFVCCFCFRPCFYIINFRIKIIILTQLVRSSATGKTELKFKSNEKGE
jgi:hypothetical protein